MMIENVYISYTRELANYAGAAKFGIENLSLQPLIFEEFSKNLPNLSPLAMMRNRLEDSDVFVGIYGCRYGGIPGVDLDGNPNTQGTSYVDLEYSKAVEMGIPRIIFVLRREVSCPEVEETADRAAKLTGFLDRLLQDELVSFYGSEDELLIALLIRLANLLPVHPMFGQPARGAQYRHDVFMVMPFANQFTTIYTDHIKKAIEDCGLNIKRGDDFFADHAIIQDVWTAIARCRLVVADCTGKNPNVFYELGIAHTLGKPTILIAQDIKDVPFDVQHLRVLIYSNTESGLEKLESDLKSSVKKVLGL